jgi:hypothetical protein
VSTHHPDVCALGHKPLGLRYRRFNIASQTIPGKRVRVDVDDVHNIGTLPPPQLQAAAVGRCQGFELQMNLLALRFSI